MQPLKYLNTAGGMIWVAACALIGILLTWLYYRVINRMPAAWLCDYNETPSEELLSGKRVNYRRSGIFMSAVTAVCLILCRLQYNKGFDIYFIALSLIIVVSLMVAICDIKYTIIPDQFTIFIAVLGAVISIYDIVRGYGILHTTWWSPLAGAAMGAAVMLIIDFIGMIVYKKDGMGFGDVKLFGAVGIITGFPGTILAFAVSMVTAMICFCIILIIVRVLSRKASAENGQETVPASDGAAASAKLSETTGLTDGHQNKSEPADTRADSLQDGTSITAPSDSSVNAAGVKSVPAEGTSADAADVKNVPAQGTSSDATDVKNASAEGASNEESGESGEGEQQDSSGYLAFGPYIAAALVCYLVFNDLIWDLVDMYLKLF